MDSKTSGIIKQLIIVMVVTMVVAYIAISHLYPGGTLLLTGAISVAMFFLFFGTFTFLTLSKAREDGMKYNRTFMALKTIKMFLALFGAVIFSLVNRDWAVPFLVVFAIIYVIYTVFEAIALMKLK